MESSDTKSVAGPASAIGGIKTLLTVMTTSSVACWLSLSVTVRVIVTSVVSLTSGRVMFGFTIALLSKTTDGLSATHKYPSTVPLTSDDPLPSRGYDNNSSTEPSEPALAIGGIKTLLTVMLTVAEPVESLSSVTVNIKI